MTCAWHSSLDTFMRLKKYALIGFHQWCQRLLQWITHLARHWHLVFIKLFFNIMKMKLSNLLFPQKKSFSRTSECQDTTMKSFQWLIFSHSKVDLSYYFQMKDMKNLQSMVDTNLMNMILHWFFKKLEWQIFFIWF